MNSEEPVGERDAVWLADDQISAVPDDRAADLAANNGLLNENLRVVVLCGFDRTLGALLLGRPG